jgi:hypothetical protein
VGDDVSRRWWVGVALAVVVPAQAGAQVPAWPDRTPPPSQAGIPQPSWPWLITQLLPSPGVAVASEGGERSGLWLQWQLTPVLWAWGLRRDVPRSRVLVAEPPARVGGSVELHLSPDYFSLADPQTPAAPSRWGMHTGVRTWWPLHMRGDYLAAAVGAHVLWWNGQVQPGVDAGLSILFGVLGIHGAWQPATGSWQLGLKVRYF